ncbi:MAG: DeoR/GlpR transcriptional regulator [Limisphaerales bacterium]|nr:GntR family transcriptional regulator [Verrucomicrobiales bacterium]RZO61087.1 MAG: DeoR/GlpR transcriptional regulator [Limisphaerales bacterium]|tara:strand:- start:35 stop:853 length:819 start_codon:yes stop_codon:yes gene_type:complete
MIVRQQKTCKIYQFLPNYLLMQAEERQFLIEQHLQKVEFASLEELSEKVDVSISTVRRDLTLLETKGTIRRTHGGARLITPKSDEFTFSARDTHQLTEKDLIGHAAASLIKPNQGVIIDAGTTAYHVAKHLGGKASHIITNSLPVANHFGSDNSVEVLVTGGVIYPRLGVLVGPLAVESLSMMHADIAIMSGGGITLDGVTNSHALLIDIQRAMLKSAQHIIFCLDHTKFSRRSVSHLCEISAIDTVVTDKQSPKVLVEQLKQSNTKVVIAE